MANLLLQLLALALFLFSIPTNADNRIQVNYYYDGGCSDFAVSPPNVPNALGSGDSYGYQWTYSNSANVANCDGYLVCVCLFYTGPNLEGSVQVADYGGHNCASDWGVGFQSFQCFYY